MYRFAILVLTFAACGGLPAMPGDVESDAVQADDCEWDSMATNHELFVERLAEIQRTCDVYPWIETLRLGPAPEDPEAPAPPVPFTFGAASWKRSYGMLVREFGVFALGTAGHIVSGDTHPSGYVSDLPVDILYEIDNERQSSMPVLSRSMLGDLDRGWHGVPEGLYLRKQSQINFEITTRGRVYGEGYVYLVARGYRLYPKGIVSPVQLTKDEHRHFGRRLRPFNFAMRLQLGVAGSNDKATAKLLITDDFLATGVRSSSTGMGTDAVLEPDGVGNLGHAIEMRIKTDREMMSGPSARMLVAGPSKSNEWTWDLPVTLEAGTEIEVEVQLADIADWGFNGATVEVEVIFPGYKIERVR